jgi:hypothetical protein
VVLELLECRRPIGVKVAAANDLGRLAAEAEIFERMDERRRAATAYLDLAVAALARAELVHRWMRSEPSA